MRRPTTSKLLFAHPCVPIVCEFLEACSHCRDCSGSSPDDLEALSRKVAVDLGIESPDVMRPGLIERGFLAKKPEHHVGCAARPGIPWTRQKYCRSSLTQRRMLKSPKLMLLPERVGRFF